MNFQEDLSAIKTMMQRSTRFSALSGISGILAGLYALVGVCIALYNSWSFQQASIENLTESKLALCWLGISVAFAAIATAAFFSHRQIRKQGLSFWNHAIQKMLTNFLMPLIAGGIVLILLFLRGPLEWIPGMSLLFYGLALHAASRDTYPEIRLLGWIQAVLGILALWYPHYAIAFWATGFGLFHIGYGAYFMIRYER